MWAASCLASCCASCACGACSSVVGGISRRSSRIANCGLLALSLVVSWILREVAAPLMEKIPWINHFQSAKIFFWFVMVILMFFIPNGVASFYARIIKKRLNTIVLVGLSGSGKTMLFFQLRDGSSNRGTVTSMEQNDDTLILPSELKKRGKMNPVRVVDVPGHSRLRPKLDDVLPQAAGLIFVVDALDFLPNCRATSEYLYDILTKASVVKKKIPLLVLCNKTDKVTAHSKEFIKKQLEKEIDKLRSSRIAISTADVTNEYTLGVSGEPFKFSQCHNKVTVGEASGLTGEITQVEQFIRETVKP